MNRFALLVSVLCLLAASAAVQAEEPDAGLVEAEALYRAEGPTAALPQFEQLLSEFQAADDRLNAAAAQRFIGECHWRLGSFEESRVHLEAALALVNELGDQLEGAKILNVFGLLEWDLGNFDAAIARFEEASSIGRALGDPRLEGATLNNLSLVYDEMGDYDASLERYREVLRIYSQVDFPRGEGDTLGNIGGVYLVLGKYTEAAEYYGRALEISEDLDSVPAMSQDHGNLGLAYAGLGQTEQALAHLQRALALAEQAGMRQEQGSWLQGMGNVQVAAGRYDQGLESHREALTIYRQDGANPMLLDGLHDMGQLLLSLGDPGSAERFFSEAIELSREMDSPRGTMINQLALGDLQYRHRRLEAAAALFAVVLEQARQSGTRQLEARALISLATVHGEQQLQESARTESGQALEIARQIQALPLECEALLSLAEIDRMDGLQADALGRYQAAAEIAEELADPDLQWRIDYGRALAQVASGELNAAIDSLERAVRHIESVRSRLREDRFRTGYLQDKQKVYVELVRLQLELGQTGAAFSTAERLRTWAFAEQTGQDDRSSWTEAQRAAETSMRERVRQLQRLLDEEGSLPLPEQRQRAVATYSRELLLVESQYQAFLDDVLASGAGGARSAPPGHELTRTALGKHEALIEYVVGPGHVMMFVLRPGGIKAQAVPASRRDLHARLELLRDLLQDSGNERWTLPAAKLAEVLTEPARLEGWLEGVEHIYLVPHGMLNYLPFALLPFGPDTDAGLLIERFSVSYLPTAAALNGGYDEVAGPRSILALAPARSRLRHAPQEADALANLFKPHATSLTGTAATETAFREQAAGFQLLHLATHGYFNKLNPLLSGLELEADESHDGLLEVHEILGLKLNAELVTLSACQTGMGSGFFTEIPAGDEFVGMTRAFLQAGSASVLATLWEVNDRSTVDLMENFYTRLEDLGADGDKAVALANAQRALRASEQYKHPYFWAPFVLVGPLHNRKGVRG